MWLKLVKETDSLSCTKSAAGQLKTQKKNEFKWDENYKWIKSNQSTSHITPNQWILYSK